MTVLTKEEVMLTLMSFTFMDYQDPVKRDNFKSILEGLLGPQYNIEEQEAFLILTITSTRHTLVLSYSMEHYCWTVIHQARPTPELWGSGMVERSSSCQIAAADEDDPLRERGFDHDVWFTDPFRIDDVNQTIYPIVAGFLKVAAAIEYIGE